MLLETTETQTSDENKRCYLQLIQEPICRMSTNSAIFKGFAATITAGISTIDHETVNLIVLGLSFLPVLIFAIMDIYYLMLERKFRFLFKQVAEGQHDIDFSLELTKDPLEIIKAKARVIDCVKSPSVGLFYPILIAILVVVFILKYSNKV